MPTPLETEIRHLVAVGRPGARLPSVRELTRKHHASPVTVQRLITRLELEGLVEAFPGRGTFVADASDVVLGDPSWQTVALGARGLPAEGLADLLAPVTPGTITLATGYPDESLQALALLTAATMRAARRPTAWSRVPTEGIAPLRAWFASESGPGIDLADILVTPGGQSALSTAFRALAVPGDAIVVESPTYVGALEGARLAGLRAVPVPTDVDGIRSDLLTAALAASGAKLVYLQPLVANPTGATLSAERRIAVLDAVRAANAFLIEDDYARDLVDPAVAPPTLMSDDVDGHVVRIRSLTKSIAPGLRIAAMIARGPAMARLRNTRLIDDFFVSGVLQEAAVDVLTSTGRPRQLSRVRHALTERMSAATDAIERMPGVELAVRPIGGFVLWVRLLGGLEDDAVVAAARSEGVLVSPGHRWFAAEPPAAHLRLSVAATDQTQIAQAMRVLRRVTS